MEGISAFPGVAPCLLHGIARNLYVPASEQIDETLGVVPVFLAEGCGKLPLLVIAEFAYGAVERMLEVAGHEVDSVGDCVFSVLELARARELKQRGRLSLVSVYHPSGVPGGDRVAAIDESIAVPLDDALVRYEGAVQVDDVDDPVEVGPFVLVPLRDAVDDELAHGVAHPVLDGEGGLP